MPSSAEQLGVLILAVAENPRPPSVIQKTLGFRYYAIFFELSLFQRNYLFVIPTRLEPHDWMNDVSKSLSLQILVLRCQTGDESAFATILEQFHPRLSYFVRKMLDDPHQVDDVMQNVWLDVFRRIGQLRNPAAFSTWAYRIARDHVYRLHRKVRLPTAELNEGDAAIAVDETDSFGSEDARRIHESLDELSREHREVLMLRFLDELNYEEIAEITNCEIGTVKSRVHYAKRALKHILKQEHE
jgi:RNA polymerase sigma-70 factor (ECF subfamily)